MNTLHPHDRCTRNRVWRAKGKAVSHSECLYLQLSPAGEHPRSQCLWTGLHQSPPLHLIPYNHPQSSEQWVQANEELARTQVPAVLAAPTVEKKNKILCEGIHDYFTTKFGTKKQGVKQRCGIQSGIRAKLSALREKRNKAWNELQRVKHRDTTDITSLATCFHKYLREYNKASQAEKKRVKASTARRLCSKNFVKFARDVLAGEDIQNAPDVEFSQDAAEEFFFRVYDSVPMAFEQPSWLPDTPLPQNQFLCFSM